MAAAENGMVAADLARLTAGWARFELGAGEATPPLRKIAFPALAGAVPESEALAALARRRRDRSLRAPSSAPRSAGTGYSLARALRCRLGAGLAELAQGRHVAAREHIEQVVHRARASAGSYGSQDRAERALRRAGGPNSGLRALLSPGELTPREIDVMRLVRGGSTSARIADTLGHRTRDGRLARALCDGQDRCAHAPAGIHDRGAARARRGRRAAPAQLAHHRVPAGTRDRP